MHPIERLRYVARAEGAGPSVLVREAAAALADFTDDPVGLVTACRRLVDRHPTVGPLWWLASRVLAAAEPEDELCRAGEEVHADETGWALAAALPDDATVVVVGWPEQVAEALRRRGDVEVLIVDAAGDGAGLCRRLRRAGVQAVDVPDVGLGPAVARSHLVVLEASALGPDGFVATTGSRAAAAVARHAGLPVWVAAGVGRVLPARLWRALADRLDRASPPPWDRAHEVVPLALADLVAGPGGLEPAAEAPARGDFPVAPELLKQVG